MPNNYKSYAKLPETGTAPATDHGHHRNIAYCRTIRDYRTIWSYFITHYAVYVAGLKEIIVALKEHFNFLYFLFLYVMLTLI